MMSHANRQARIRRETVAIAQEPWFRGMVATDRRSKLADVEPSAAEQAATATADGDR